MTVTWAIGKLPGVCVSAGRVAAQPGERTRARRAVEHAARDAAQARAGHVIETVGDAVEDRVSRAQPAADRRPDPLAQVACGKSGGIPGDERIAAAHRLDLAPQEIAVAAGLVPGPGRELLETGSQELPVPADVVTGVLHAGSDPADADVQPAALLGHVPGVAGQPVPEEPQVAVA